MEIDYNKKLKSILVLLSLMFSTMTHAKNKLQTYCFESPNISFGKADSKILKKITFSFVESNSSTYYESNVSLHYTLTNGKTYALKETPYCHYDGSLYQCDHDNTDRAGGYFEFDLKNKSINIENFCIFDCSIQFTIPWELEEELIIDDMSSLHNTRHGDVMNTMLPYEKINNEKERVWVKGYACEAIKPKDVTQVYYYIQSYETLSPSVKNQELHIQYFYNIINKEDNNTFSITLENKYRDISTMMNYEGYNSYWINNDDIELFIYNDKRALIHINKNAKSLSKNTCLNAGYYLMELDKNHLMVKKF